MEGASTLKRHQQCSESYLGVGRDWMRWGKCLASYNTWEDVLCGHMQVSHYEFQTQVKTRLWGLILCCQFGWDTTCPDIGWHGLSVYKCPSGWSWHLNWWPSKTYFLPQCGLHPIDGVLNRTKDKELILTACSSWDSHPFRHQYQYHTTGFPLSITCT